MSMYAIVTAVFIGLALILLLLRHRKYRHQVRSTLPTKSNKIVHSRPKQFNSLKQFLNDKASIFDEQNRDGRDGYFPWV